ncbi:contactin-like [Mercenaria mercenaria]|uniref:contactin-like n=1 Tax=Mercenaria mercenaria TaxID=6596 RepID=UPI00234EFABE|nr:contactin-like [Mercenaria mercenaria]
MWTLWLLFSWIVISVEGQSQTCPVTWQTYQQTCYLFYMAEPLDYIGAVEHCHSYGSSVVSVNSQGEHNFIIQQLRIYNAAGYEWYTSGTSGVASNHVEWDGDGSIAVEEWWFSEEDRLLTYPRIVYKTDSVVYGWSRVPSVTKLPFVCEISQIEAYRISQDDRDFTYGTNFTDINLAPRGPRFIIQPENLVVVEEDSRSDTDGESFTISLACMAEGNPMPTYSIRHTYGNGTVVDITTDMDTRYTLIGGRLVIEDPTETKDAGIYQCLASNIFGTIYSEVANITFGVLEHFSNVQRAPVVAMEYQSAAIECSPPPYKPAVSYQWYRGQIADFVRPDLNPYIFISSNGKLYFSEVTKNDEADYRCIVKLTSGSDAMSTYQPPSRISLPIPLQINHQVPATWGPEIADGFIASFPNKPLRGNTVKLECLAYGTLPFTYSWSRKDYPLPSKTTLSDHNRILEIVDVQIEDAGTYYCTVVRDTGARVQAVHNLVIETRPYFRFPLPDQHADINSQLTWRCEANTIPLGVYIWYKNGELLHSVPGDIEIKRNVITIQSLDPMRHDGMYQCVCLNTHGYSFSSAQLRVLAFKPSFAKRPRKTSQTAAIGGHVTLDCSPEAAPSPEYTWNRNGANVNPPPDDGVSRVRLLADGSLYIGQVDASDAGTYCCIATNSYGSDSSCGELKVVSNTVITLPPQNTIGRINVTSVLLCDASFPGNVDNIFIWRFNGRELNLNNNAHLTLGTTQYPGALYVRSARYEHTGIYTCVAKTTYDSVNVSASFTVEGPPGPPAGVRLDRNTITSTSAVVIWTEGETHGRPTEFHNIEACTEYNTTWVPIYTYIPYTVSQITGTQKHTVNVEDLKSGNGYFFRVRAVNALGVGEASRSSAVYRIPGAAPSKYPDDIGGGGGTVGILTITWTPLPPEDQGGSGIGYVVYWRLANTTTKFMEATVTENVGQFATTVGSEYFYMLYEVKVSAFNEFGPGPVSPGGVYIYSAEEMPIGVARNVYAWPYNSTALEVSWDVIPNDREHMRGKLLGYQVNYQLRFVEGASLDAISWRGETSSGIVIGLDTYTWYTVDVQLLTNAGMGPRGEVYHAHTHKQAPILYPTEIHIYSHTAESVRIEWRGVSTTSVEENLEGYKVRYWPTTDDVRSAKDVVTDRIETEAVIYGIQKDIVYECRVLGFSRGGDGKHSSSVYFTLGGLVAFDPSSSEILASANSFHPSYVTCILSLVFVSFINTCTFF